MTKKYLLVDLQEGFEIVAEVTSMKELKKEVREYEYQTEGWCSLFYAEKKNGIYKEEDLKVI